MLRICIDERGNFRFNYNGDFSDIYRRDHIRCEICGKFRLEDGYTLLLERLKQFLTDDTAVCCRCYDIIKQDTMELVGDGVRFYVGPLTVACFNKVGTFDYHRLDVKYRMEFGEMPVTLPATSKMLKRVVQIAQEVIS